MDGTERWRPFWNVISVTVLNRWIRGVTTTGLGVVFLAAIVIEAIAIAQSWGAEYWFFGGAAATVVCLLALLRRGRQGWTAALGLAVAVLAILTARLFHLPAEPGPALTLGLSVLIGSGVRILPPVQAGAVAGGGFAVVAGSGLAVLSASSGGATVVVLNGLAWLAAVVVGVSLRLLDSRARATARQVRRAERLELARELHDVVAHHITGMLIQAQAAQVVARKNPGEVMESLADIEVAGSEALVAMRSVVGLLRDTDDAAPVLPGSEEVSTLVERFNRPDRPAVSLHMPEGDTAWPPEVTSTVYGIVQESLTNVLRHAPHAHSVTVTVDQDSQGVTVEVVDDAPQGSICGHHRGGYGLVGMRERVEILGGTLHAGRGSAAGWSVRATLPIPAREH